MALARTAADLTTDSGADDVLTSIASEGRSVSLMGTYASTESESFILISRAFRAIPVTT